MRLLTPIFILSLISYSFTSQGQKNDKLLDNQKIWYSSEFYPDLVREVRSMNDGQHFSALEKGTIVKYNYEDFDKDAVVIADGQNLSYEGKKIEIENYDFNANESKILIANEINHIYRRSWEGQYYIYDLKTQELTKLSNDTIPQRLAEFSPTGNHIAYVSNNNLFVYELSTGKTDQITQDGEINAIINGTTDWVYEEEFAITKAFEWSAQGTKIAFLRFDESDVKEFSMEYYHNELYPELYTFKYPKAGEDNSKVTLHIFNTGTENTKQISLGDYEYIPRIKWTNDDNLLFALTMNRHQNHLVYHKIDCSKNEPVVNTVYEETSKTYVDIDDNLIFLENENAFIRTSEKDGYNHIYKIDFEGNDKQLTKGKWDVVEFKGVNQEKGLIYYISAEEGVLYRSLYVVDLKGENKTKLSEKKGHNDASFSNGMKYYINTWDNANTPPEITLHKADGAKILTIKDNAALKSKLKEYQLSEKEFLTIKGAEDTLNAWMIKPPGFKPNKKYPVYMFVYGGPGKNEVSDSWGYNNYLYHQLLAQKGYIVLSVDPRGTMYRGEAFKKATYLQLGKLETEDLIAVAKEIGTWKFIDSARIGIQGWSYGGYMSSLAITKGADYFKTAIAVAPVTNWKFYDNIYTERFMRTPQENKSGYDDNSPINHVAKLKGKYLLVHGSGDDNVHYQNTMEMINALVNANKEFDLFIYPNRNHGIYGGTTRLHLFNKMLNFTLENL